MVAIVDVNLDGRPDLVTANREATTVSVLLNQGQNVVTAALLVMFEGSWTASGIELRWQLGTDATSQAVTLRRSENEQGPWSDLGTPSHSDGGTTTFTDSSVQPGHAYFYRLFAATSSGGAQMLGSVAVGAMSVAAPGLLSVTPSPSRGMTRIKFAVARESRVSLSVVDVQGRRVRSLLNAMRSPGEYSLTWDGASDNGTAPPGLYFLRYEADGEQAIRRIVRFN